MAKPKHRWTAAAKRKLSISMKQVHAAKLAAKQNSAAPTATAPCAHPQDVELICDNLWERLNVSEKVLLIAAELKTQQS